MQLKLFDIMPSIIHVVLKSPLLYKLGLLITFLLIGILLFYGHRMYRESQRYHDFSVQDTRIFVESQFNERTLSFDIESLSEDHIYINQISIALYDNQNKNDSLDSLTKNGRINPLKKGDKFPIAFILDNPPKMGFNFTEVIKNHKYVMQSYKIIIVIHYNKNSLNSIIDQRFEYLYKVFHDEGVINGIIEEFPNQMEDSKRIYKRIQYDRNS